MLLYLINHDATSKTALAAVKPKKVTVLGLNMKLMTVAISPTTVAEPSLCVHQTVIVNAVKPIISHRKGSPNI